MCGRLSQEKLCGGFLLLGDVFLQKVNSISFEGLSLRALSSHKSRWLMATRVSGPCLSLNLRVLEVFESLNVCFYVDWLFQSSGVH
jgi:hypothetical protein